MSDKCFVNDCLGSAQKYVLGESNANSCRDHYHLLDGYARRPDIYACLRLMEKKLYNLETDLKESKQFCKDGTSGIAQAQAIQFSALSERMDQIEHFARYKILTESHEDHARRVLRKVPWTLCKNELPKKYGWYEVTGSGAYELDYAFFHQESKQPWLKSVMHPSSIIAWRPILSEPYKEKHD